MVDSRRRLPPLDGIHRVQVGDSVPSVAYEYGHHWATIWAHPKNKELREKRKNPNILHEGDALFIPPLRMKSHDGQTDKRHRFRHKDVPSILRVRLFEPPRREVHTLRWLLDQKPSGSGGGGEMPEPLPWAGVDYVMTIDGMETRGRTDDAGVVSVTISPTTERAALVVAPGTENERTLPLYIGHIHPIDTMAGARERLQNMGFTCDAANADDADAALAAAVLRFQVANKLEATGDLDEVTRRKLLDVYGS